MLLPLLLNLDSEAAPIIVTAKKSPRTVEISRSQRTGNIQVKPGKATIKRG